MWNLRIGKDLAMFRNMGWKLLDFAPHKDSLRSFNRWVTEVTSWNPFHILKTNKFSSLDRNAIPGDKTKFIANNRDRCRHRYTFMELDDCSKFLCQPFDCRPVALASIYYCGNIGQETWKGLYGTCSHICGRGHSLFFHGTSSPNLLRSEELFSYHDYWYPDTSGGMSLEKNMWCYIRAYFIWQAIAPELIIIRCTMGQAWTSNTRYSKYDSTKLSFACPPAIDKNGDETSEDRSIDTLSLASPPPQLPKATQKETVWPTRLNMGLKKKIRRKRSKGNKLGITANQVQGRKALCRSIQKR